MNRFERIMTALESMIDLRFGQQTIMRKYNPLGPFNAQGIITHREEPNSVTDITINAFYYADCGHTLTFGMFPIQCVCGKSFCSDCAIKEMKHCNVCGRPIFNCCCRHSHISGKDYCVKHKWSFLAGR
jgi:hypothetical protein